MNKGFKMTIALCLYIVLSAGLMVACGEELSGDAATTAVNTTSAQTENTEAGNIGQTANESTAMTETVEETPVELLPGVEENPFNDGEETTPATQGSFTGGDVSGTDVVADGNVTAVTTPTAGNSATVTTAPAAGGNTTEIFVPIAPPTGATAIQGTADGADPTTPPDESGSVSGLSYEEYIAMSGAEQMEYFESFDSVEDYFAWYNAAKAEYDRQNPAIEIEDGNIDLGDIIGGN